MNSLSIKMPKLFCFLLGLFSVSLLAQEPHKKVVTESFQVKKDVVIELDATYTEIEFDTWNKDKVEVEAVLEVFDATKEEAASYDKNWNFEALGNSSKVSIVAKYNPNNSWHFRTEPVEFDIVEPIEIDIVEPVIITPELEEEIIIMTDELHKMPPVPHLDYNEFKVLEFDYEAYKKDKDAYMKKWKAQLNKAHKGDFKKSLEEWKKKMEEWKREVHKNRREVLIERKEVNREKRRELLEKRKEELEKRKELIKIRVQEAKDRARAKSNTFYYKGGESKKAHKVKRKVKIRMPKDASLKLNVRHGEVKLTENSRVNAKLKYTKMYANRIDGVHTTINASYSPLVVNHWNEGSLFVDYNKNVVLKNVASIALEANSANVKIYKLLNTAKIAGSFGELAIDAIAESFDNMTMVLNNANAVIALPDVDYNLNYKGSHSKLVHPKNTSTNQTSQVVTTNNNSSKTIQISANYSTVTFD